MEKEITKEYTNGELTIVWKPKKCIHAAACVHALPEVYKPKEKPWINANNATTEDLKKQIDQCPSGALTYYIKGEEEDTTTVENTKVEVVKGGPLLVFGSLDVTSPSGECTQRENRTAFCRCGASQNKPYCDGAHKGVEFDH